mmetsp:Transcript_22371/g.26953  ORF Transcript_22371/g.26953 Transcript_22371/m.26953 type:complete len:226 (+) Transcript_22371:185-862(+)|eukprot:CAMPEP_0197849672 /NCGR_PEP_ID=MMETSP1438-20131217/12861_1 /TAXON_ID=1461541 /ORGANISM="Pterosperma sp., Strain CCMP1384" /LENGTH=225 /DNA_ID=CAMNT_0043462455 /DNA_START=185 /DNA_END=862 /DNA_ORIENTATION=+
MSKPVRLLLTSSGFTGDAKNQFSRLLDGASKDHPNGSKRVVYIPDAATAEGMGPDGMYGRMQRELCSAGASDVTLLPLANADEASVYNALEGAACVYVEMGNTYFVTYQARRSGFDKLVTKFCRERGMLFSGASAGAILAGRTIKVCFWKGWDDPGYGQSWDLTKTPHGYDGLNLMANGESLFPHYSNQWAGRVKEMKPKHEEEVVILDEYHCFVQDESGGRLMS